MKQRQQEERLTAIILRAGGVGILQTDTLYGIVGSALNPKTVRRIYRLRQRNSKKPMIILIDSISCLQLFDIKLSSDIKKVLNKVWPGKVSIVLPLGRDRLSSKKFHYLHRGKGTLAFRWPRSEKLCRLLKEVGPLVAPSANFEGQPPARTISEAKKYFGDKVDFYCDGGKPAAASPSTLIAIEKGKIVILRQGSVKLMLQLFNARR